VDPKWLQLTAGHFGHSVYAPKAQDASPHTNYLSKLLKSTPRRSGRGKRAAQYSHRLPAVNGLTRPQAFNPRTVAGRRLQGPRSIAPIRGLSTHCHIVFGGPQGPRRTGAGKLPPAPADAPYIGMRCRT